MVRALSLDPLTLDVSSPEMVDFAADAGFDHVGFWIIAPFDGFPRPILRKDTADFEQVREKLTSRGLTAGNLEVFNLTPQFRADRACQAALETGALLGAASATAVFMADIDEALALDKLKELCRAAADFGLRINVEFMALSPSMNSMAQAIRVVENAHAANAALTMDCLHLMRTGATLEEIAKLDPAMVGHIQICDGPMNMPAERQLWEAGDHRLYPGEGEFPLAEIFRLLPKDKIVGAEIPRTADMQNGISQSDIAKRCRETATALLAAVDGGS